jgi:hypothetical protein
VGRRVVVVAYRGITLVAKEPGNFFIVGGQLYDQLKGQSRVTSVKPKTEAPELPITMMHWTLRIVA